MEQILTAGSIAMLVVEGIKLFWRKVIVKNPLYDFPTAFYTISLPLLNALAPFVLLFLGMDVTAPVVGMTLIELGRYLALVILGSLVSLVEYSTGLKPLKVYAQELRIKKAAS